jgi:glycosyltransferase involved in cell wall biosynthesis
MTTTPAVSVVLPVYRNRSDLPELHRRLTAVLAPGPVYELVFVDDVGDDGSREWLAACGETDTHVRLIALARNGGQHAAVLRGLTDSRGAVVVVMDADLQDPPEAIPRLIGRLGDGVDVVFARRSTRHQSAGRHVTGRLFKRLLRRLAGSRVPAGTGMFFAAARTTVDAAVARAAGARYVPLLLDETGAGMAAIDVEKVLRPDSPSGYSAARRLTLAVAAVRQALGQRRSRRRRSTDGGPRAPTG